MRQRLMRFLSGIRGRLARLMIRVGAVLFLVLLTGVLLAPDSMLEFVGEFSLVVRGAILAAVYAMIALIYQVRIDRYLGLHLLRKLLTRPKKAEAAPPEVSGSAPVQPLTRPEVITKPATPAPPEQAAESVFSTPVETEQRPEPTASAPAEPGDSTHETETIPRAMELAQESSTGDDDDPDFWDFLRSTAKDEQDDADNKS